MTATTPFSMPPNHQTDPAATSLPAVELVLRDLPEPIAPPWVRQRLTRMALSCPPIPSGIFEARLSSTEAAVDLAQVVLPRTADLAADFYREQARMQSSPHLSRACSTWADPSHPTRQLASELWLEKDHDAPIATPPFYGYRLAADHVPGDVHQLANEVIAGFPTVARSMILGPAFARCLDASPRLGEFAHLGVMPSRGVNDSVRLEFHPADSPSAFLQFVGWPGRFDRVSRVVRMLEPTAGAVDLLQIDVGERVRPRLGIEFTCEKFADSQDRWAATLDVLVSAGLCCPAKASALVSWPGHRRVDGALPSEMRAATEPRRAGPIEAFARRLTHFKIVLGADGLETAKIYLWFAHGYFRQG